MLDNVSHPQSINPSAMYRARDCARFYSIGLSTWWHWAKTGKAKRGTKIGPKTTVWDGAYLLELKQKLMTETESRGG
ncbi:helix-turn-helix transcriptional regulator [Microbulbifer sp. 2201CG32-9]|uniref:helix-turn-helix transcriptional regulator n=1 Tax=Microbulbifer sp. 2201CG32-9 TaxID=3232309 RepID=UPI00345BCD06